MASSAGQRGNDQRPLPLTEPGAGSAIQSLVTEFTSEFKVILLF